MPKRTRLHHDTLLEDLQDPRASAHYLNAALEDSDEMLLIALRNVAEASTMSKVAKEAGISRESIYRMLCKSGNPTYGSFTAILRALGLRIAVEADIVGGPSAPPSAPSERKLFAKGAVVEGASTTTRVTPSTASVPTWLSDIEHQTMPTMRQEKRLPISLLPGQLANSRPTNEGTWTYA